MSAEKTKAVGAMQLIMAQGTTSTGSQKPYMVSLTANVDGNTLQRRRSMKTDSLKPILKTRLASL